VAQRIIEGSGKKMREGRGLQRMAYTRKAKIIAQVGTKRTKLNGRKEDAAGCVSEEKNRMMPKCRKKKRDARRK